MCAFLKGVGWDGWVRELLAILCSIGLCIFCLFFLAVLALSRMLRLFSRLTKFSLLGRNSLLLDLGMKTLGL